MLKDPAVAFTNVYTSLTYGIYCELPGPNPCITRRLTDRHEDSFFEVFPLVYPPIYGFNLGETGLTFIVIGMLNDCSCMGDTISDKAHRHCMHLWSVHVPRLPDLLSYSRYQEKWNASSRASFSPCSLRSSVTSSRVSQVLTKHFIAFRTSTHGLFFRR